MQELPGSQESGEESRSCLRGAELRSRSWKPSRTAETELWSQELAPPGLGRLETAGESPKASPKAGAYGGDRDGALGACPELWESYRGPVVWREEKLGATERSKNALMLTERYEVKRGTATMLWSGRRLGTTERPQHALHEFSNELLSPRLLENEFCLHQAAGWGEEDRAGGEGN